MDEIKFGQAMEKEFEKEEILDIGKAIEEDIDNPETDKTDAKSILITIVVLIGIFAVLIGGFNYYNGITSAAVIDVDQLHQDNLEGNLDEEEGYLYNGFSFIYTDGLWWTEIQYPERLLKIPLHFGPKELEEIPVTGSLSSEFNKKSEVYISIDPKVSSGHYAVAMRELGSNIAQGINKNSHGACIEEHPGCDNRSILNCEDTKSLSVIELEIASEPAIELSGTCIKIKGDGYGIIKAANRLIYQWYGIMK